MNDFDSNTGMNLPRHFFAKIAARERFFNEVRETGSHRARMEAVVTGRADTAAIDCVTFGLHAEYEPAITGGLRVLAQTSASPSIPFVTLRETTSETVEALQRALRTFSNRADFASVRRALRIARIEAPSDADYEVLSDYRAQAVAMGYPVLA